MIFKIFYNVKDIFTKSNKYAVRTILLLYSYFLFNLCFRYKQKSRFKLTGSGFRMTDPGSDRPDPGSDWPNSGSNWRIRVQIARILVQIDQIQVQINRIRVQIDRIQIQIDRIQFRLTEFRFRLIGSRFTRSRFRLTGSGFRLTFLSLLLSVETDFTDSREIFFRLNPDSYSIFKKNWSGSEPFQKPDSNSAVLWT